MQPLQKRLETAPRHPRPREPVPIALVITELNVGGAERALVELATGLDRGRWSPSVIALGSEGPLAGPLRDAAIPVHFLDLSPRAPWRGVFRLAQTLRAARPRLVQSFLFHANVATRLAAGWAGRPWVVGGIRVAEREKSWHRALERLTARLGAGWVCVSRGVARFSVEVTRLCPERLTVIPNGIRLEPFDRAEPLPRAALGVPNNARMILFVGRFTYQKGVDVLLRAMGRVARYDTETHLVLIGEGPDAGSLQAMGRSLDGLIDRIHWLGPRGDVPSMLRTADLLVLPSRWEGMPNVVLEAMAASRAVVATAVEGTEDLVLPGATGWLVAPDDPIGLAEALEDALASPERCADFGRAGRLRVERDFSQAAVIEAYDRLWSGLLGFDEDGSPDRKPTDHGERPGIGLPPAST